MSAPLSTTTGRRGDSESHAWQELEEVFAALGQLARSPIAPAEFYRNLLDQCVRALSASGGAVWLRSATEVLQPVAQLKWPREQFAADDAARLSHEALLTDAAMQRRVVSIPARSRDNEGNGEGSCEHGLLLGPVQVHQSDGESTTRAIVELLLRPDLSPATYRGCEQFLTAVCELACDFHAFHDLHELRDDDRFRSELLRLGRAAHSQLDLAETAYTVANEGRGIVGCDRLSVLVARGRRCRLLATSGVSRIERRSGAARRLAQVAEQVCRTDEAAYYADGQSDALPPVADVLEQHAEESHARQVAAMPLRRPENLLQAEADRSKKLTRPRERPQFVLVAEQFDARGIDRGHLMEVADVCRTALYNAWEYDRLPLGWLTRPLGAAKHQITSHLPRTVFIVAAVAAAIAALILVPADFNVETGGKLQPVVRRDVFAPRNGLIDEVLVKHGAGVQEGEPLVRMRDPALELDIKRAHGEIETAQRQLDAVRATRTNRAIREENANDAYRLSAEERELQQRLTNLRRELELLQHEREQLTVTAPIAGTVLTWEMAHRLASRPIDRGEVLVTVADLDQDWQLELEVPDDRIGYVLAAQQAIQTDLPVTFKLSSDDREQHAGHIAEVCQTAVVEESPGVAPTPTVLVKVALDKLELSEQARSELRPGVSARAQIACGRAPLGYVWFHDIWDTLVEWVTF